MKLNSLSVLCLSLLLFHTHFSLAKKVGGGGGFGRGFGSKKPSTSNRGSTDTNTNTGHKNNPGSSSHGGYPRQPGQPNQGGNPPQSGRPGYPGSYPQQPGGGGYHNQYPVQGSPYGGGYGGYGGHASYGGHGGYRGYGGYPGGYINQNPNNKILSPGYGGSFGYGGYNSRSGSPFSHSVQAMGVYPKDSSRGFGRSAVMAAAGGAMAGMALGYGLGRFPRPHFNFHSPQEEYYYNHYMYRKYGSKSTDTNDYSRDYKYSQPTETYDSYMDSCMKRTDLLPVVNQKPNKPAATTTTVITTTVTASVATTTAAAPDSVTGSNATEFNSTAAENSSTSAPSTPRPLNETEAKPAPAASQVLRKTATDDDDDTVSIVEIGYPALIDQLKVRRCLELYMVYSEKYLKRENGGVQGLEMGSRGLLAVVTSAILVLLNSNMLMLLH